MLIKQAIQDKQPLPEAIQNAPSIYPGGLLYYEGFWELNTCRSYGNGVVGPIPWTAVRAYADEHEFKGHSRADLFTIIRALDDAYLAKVNKKQ